MARTFAHRAAWPLEQTGYSAMLHFMRESMQENRTKAYKRPSDRPKEVSYCTDATGHGEPRIAVATNVTSSTLLSSKDSVTKPIPFRWAKKITLQTIQFRLLYASVCNIRHIFGNPCSCSF